MIHTLLPVDVRGASRCRGFTLAALCALAVGALSGCGQSPPGPGEGAEEFTIDLSTPLSSARSLLAGLQADIAASARKDRAGAKRVYQRVFSQIAATETLRAEIRDAAGGGRLSDRDIEQAVEQVVAMWAPVILHYAKTVEPSRIEVISEGAAEATLRAPATGPHGPAWIRIRTVRTPAGEWRVSRLDFQPPSAMVPASRPGSQPSP